MGSTVRWMVSSELMMFAPIDYSPNFGDKRDSRHYGPQQPLDHGPSDYPFLTVVNGGKGVDSGSSLQSEWGMVCNLHHQEGPAMTERTDDYDAIGRVMRLYLDA